MALVRLLTKEDAFELFQVRFHFVHLKNRVSLSQDGHIHVGVRIAVVHHIDDLDAGANWFADNIHVTGINGITEDLVQFVLLVPVFDNEPYGILGIRNKY
ncbi:MAG: hypothetical protein MAGBODY4_01089 [Candidatus Marinimicrobia bacterium]|nr:hypothetical protein [Candidatus Neomarinimicrobiota bacterium]